MNKFEFHKVSVASSRSVPVAAAKVNAGFPSPADDHLEQPLDLNERLVQNPESTFVVKVNGDSMRDAGIFTGDWLVVDKSLNAKDGSIVVAVVNGEFTLKRFRSHGGVTELRAENPGFPPIRFVEGDELYIWGVVKHVIKDV